MDENKGDVSPGIMLAFGTLIAGLVSVLVWLLRLGSRKQADEPSEPVKSPDLPVETTASLQSPGEKAAVSGKQAVSAPPAPFTKSSAQPTGLPAAPVAAAQAVASTSRWTVTTRNIAAVGLILAFFLLLYYSRGSLILITFAALIALLVQPAIKYLTTRLRLSQGLAVVLIYLAVATLLVALVLLIVPNLIQAVSAILSFDWEALLQRVTDYLNQTAAQAASTPGIGPGLSTSLQSLAGSINNLQSAAAGETAVTITVESMLQRVVQAVGLFASILGPLISGIVSLVFMLLISLQMSLVSGEMRGWLMKLVPERFEDEIGDLLDRIVRVWTSFLSGQFILMVVMGVLVWLMNVVLGTPQALLLGFMAGLLEVIPSLGPILATIPAAILALVFGSTNFPELNPFIFMLIVILGYALLNFIENQYLVPKILGGAVELPAVVVLIGVMIAGSTIGIAGVFLATPLIASGREILMFIYGKITENGEEELPEEKKPGLVDRLRSVGKRVLSVFRRKES
jgi:predicted PurR-regulated permease PerM